MDWTEKHRPSSLADLVGNGPAIAALRKWAEAWREGVPAKRAVILAGPPGTGKTSAALALAQDMGWSVIELNASDARNAARIKRVATAGAVHQTFALDGSFGTSGEGNRKLIVLDEADNLTERLSGENAAGGGSDLSDKGGKAQMLATVRETHQPIILIVNDLYGLTRGAGSALGGLAETLKFTRVNVRSIPKALGMIARKEGIEVDLPVLEAIAGRAGGDLRAAVRDLESICVGRTHVGMKELESVGARDSTGNMFDLVQHILKGRPAKDLRRESMDVDATPEDVVLWVDENIAKEYKDPADLARAYERLSRADVFLGRTRRRQNYRMWAYASDLATVGVSTARENEYRGYTPVGFPQWLSKMSRSRGARQTKDKLALNLGRATHQSKRKSRLHQVGPFTDVYAIDPEFAVAQTFAMELEADEVAVLLGKGAKDKAVKEIMDQVAVLVEEAPKKSAEFAFKARADPANATLDSIAAKPAKPPQKPEAKSEAPAKPEEEQEAAEAPERKPDSKERKPEGGQQKLF